MNEKKMLKESYNKINHMRLLKKIVILVELVEV